MPRTKKKVKSVVKTKVISARVTEIVAELDVLMDVSKFYHGDYYLEELKTIESK